MKKLFIIAILLSGCVKEMPDTNLNITTPTATFTQITPKPVDDDKLPSIGGKDEETIITVISVPASSVTTTIYVYDKPKKLRPRTKDEPVKPVEVISTNPATQVAYPEVTPWWYWWIGYLVAAITVYFVGKKYYDIIAKPLGYVRKVWDWLKNKSNLRN